jgi:hypothetical protein
MVTLEIDTDLAPERRKLVYHSALGPHQARGDLWLVCRQVRP